MGTGDLISRGLRRLAGRFLPLLVRRFVLERTIRVPFEGFQIVVDPGVFPPIFFGSTVFMARHIAQLPVRGSRLVEIGTGSGALALVAARAGANVVAVDIAAAAVRCATANVRRNDLSRSIEVRQADLFSDMPVADKFDYIIFNPPHFPRPQTDAGTYAWHVGDGFELLKTFALESKEHLTEDGHIVLSLSSEMDVDRILSFFATAGYEHQLRTSMKWLWETYRIFHFRRRPQAQPT